MIALEADGGDPVLDREPFGIDLPFPVADLAGAVDHRRHAEIPDPGRLSLAIAYDRPEEPEAGVGHADEVAARRQEPKRGKRAEIARRRGQFQPADEFERPEMRFVAADLEIR